VYSEKFGHKVACLAAEVDIMSMAGASPDAVVTDSRSGLCKAVFEVKCKVPFYLQKNGTSLLLHKCLTICKLAYICG
jgi:hypothetical protein